jgi:transcriptional regulator with XRE-family HTH domain
MTVGSRIRKFRKEADMTQNELADEVGLTGAAIRNYERDYRVPSDELIEKIAAALDVSPDSIREIGVTGARGALEVLFRYESELGLMPVVTDNGIAVAVDPRREGAQKAQQALTAWKRMRDDLAAGRITEKEYEAWKAQFKG